MKFRPCIDLHQGKVKQIVGESLNDNDQLVIENFVSSYDSAYYASRFQEDGLTGGHVIMLGPNNDKAAIQALQAYPNGLQIGGGIHADNAAFYLEQGASHVIVTSYIFRDGQLQMDHLDRIVSEIGKDKLVIDLSCKEKDGKWYVVTNQWRTFSDFEITADNMQQLEQYCAEFMIHAVDVEGKKAGINERLVKSLAEWVRIPTTYAGGARSFADIEDFYSLSKGKLDLTIGSALDLFGGDLPYHEVVPYMRQLSSREKK
ncbi:phosphoribosylformimino-5-aminoimidazole carboxamide ribotide isomerase [Marinicrinis sediminis]|uniref:Phosphoribosylformimino-5-aminoimidazole carboxamide ribotide isomerase n=1 Tax=Marinicrinis sediminis TaxID=1652465 RepID=A0ABW5RE75_9BACL